MPLMLGVHFFGGVSIFLVDWITFAQQNHKGAAYKLSSAEGASCNALLVFYKLFTFILTLVNRNFINSVNHFIYLDGKITTTSFTLKYNLPSCFV